MAKVLNSVSRSSEIALPTALDAEESVFRIDLNDFQLTSELWRELELRYPERTPAENAEVLQRIQGETQTEQPLLRADWLIANLGFGNLYAKALKLPANLDALERRLNVSFNQEVAQGRSRRAGYAHSIVAEFARVVERIQPTGGTAAIWRSYEFGSAGRRKDPIQSPFGPVSALPIGDGRSHLAFDPDGTEVIFVLPNGMLAFFISDRDGRRLDRTPAPASGKRAAVELGGGCLACHSRGFLFNADQVFPHFSASKSLPSTLMSRLDKLYFKDDELKSVVESDSLPYQDVMMKLGDDGKGEDPLAHVLASYQQPISLGDLAGMLGIAPDSVRFIQERIHGQRLPMRDGTESAVPQNVREFLGKIQSDHEVDRRFFDQNFLDIARFLKRCLCW